MWMVIWMALGILSLLAGLAAFVGTIIGLIIGIARKQWGVLKWSGISFGVSVLMFMVTGVLYNLSSDESEDANPPTSALKSTPSSEATATAQITLKPTVTASPVPTNTPAPSPTPFPRVTASELARAYESNEVAAKAKYEEKTALITGEVISITDARGKYDVKLLTGDVWTDIVCKVEISSVDSVIALEKGQVVTVLGKIKGKGFVDIVIDPCAVHQ